MSREENQKKFYEYLKAEGYNTDQFNSLVINRDYVAYSDKTGYFKAIFTNYSIFFECRMEDGQIDRQCFATYEELIEYFSKEFI